MPIDFPAGIHGNRFSSASTTWEYSSSVPGWSQIRDDYAGSVNSSLGADRLAEDITGTKLNLAATSTHLASDFVTNSFDGEQTVLTLSSAPAGLKLIVANINFVTEDNNEVNFKLKVAGSQVSYRFFQSPNSGSNFHTSNCYLVATSTASGDITLTQHCPATWAVTAKAGIDRTYLQYVRFTD